MEIVKIALLGIALTYGPVGVIVAVVVTLLVLGFVVGMSVFVVTGMVKILRDRE